MVKTKRHPLLQMYNLLQMHFANVLNGISFIQ